MSLGRASRAPRGIVITAEHASNRLPARYGSLGLPADELTSHIAWDEGSTELARALAKTLGAPLIEGRWSRLLVDLNRGPHNRQLIPAVSFGEEIPGNRSVSASERDQRIRNYWAPFREATAAAVENAISEAGACLHMGIHTFVPELGGVVRHAEVGLLYDPSRREERGFVTPLAAALAGAGFQVRRNYPYRGTADGHATALRRLRSDREYAGIEIEVNQALRPHWRRAVIDLTGAFASVLSDPARRRVVAG